MGPLAEAQGLPSTPQADQAPGQVVRLCRAGDIGEALQQALRLWRLQVPARQGVAQTKLDHLAGWRVSESFDARERAALDWAETLTFVAEKGAPDALYETLKAHFSDAEVSDLTLAVALMNAFNRLAVGMQL